MEVTIGGREYALSETLHSDELAPIFADAWTASRVWYASQFLSEQLVTFAAQATDPLQPRPHAFDVAHGGSVIELGSGCGLVGLVAAALGGDVLLTDQREAVELLQRNADENMHTDDEKRRVNVAEYQWGTLPTAAPLPRSTFDYILVSDCINPIYGVESWRNLARSIDMLSDDATITYLAHEARGDDEAMDDFQAFNDRHATLYEASPHMNFVVPKSRFSPTFLRSAIMDPPSIGVFWGADAAVHESEASTVRGRLPRFQPPPPTSHPAPNHSLRNAISLPNLQHALRVQLVVPTDHGAISAHDSTHSLLTVLQTLWRSIATDTHAFVQQISDGKETSERAHKALRSPYYSGGVYHEDKPYFLREKQAELQKETMRLQTQAYRELHCAPDDRQQYFFDRRGWRATARKPSATPSTTRDKNERIERRLIDRHDHKIQHLLHVLQTEMACETEREIRALTYWSPQKPLSRQSKRQVGDIIKERYEAADRIMRILEDYHIVIGVDAAKYLEETIANGMAMDRLS